ncbi:uroporphyrinogen-III synthase [Actinomycetota bacterium]
MSLPASVPGQLSGCRVIITAHRRAVELSAALERRGATVLHAPALSIVPHVDDPQLIARTHELLADPPDTVVITTGVGFTGWLEAADAEGVAPELLDLLHRARLIARGPKARGALQAAGLTADWVADSETTAEITDLLLTEGVAGHRVAVQHHGAGADGLDHSLAEAGASVCSLVVYRWGPSPDPEAVRQAVHEVARRQCDAVAFTAAPGTAAFLECARAEGVLDAVLAAFADEGGVLAAAVGSTTAAPIVQAGSTALVPDRFRMGALVRALVRELGERRGSAIDTPAGLLRVLSSAAVLDGQVLPLSPTSLAVLRSLVDARGRVVSREEILRVLPGDSSNAHAVDVAIARLREALGDRSLVATVVKRGYRLATAEPEETPGSSRPPAVSE